MNKKCLDRNRHFGALDGFEFNVAYQRALQLSEVPRILQIQILTSSAYLWSKLFLFGGSEGNALVPQHQVEFHFSLTFMQHMKYKCDLAALFLELIIN